MALPGASRTDKRYTAMEWKQKTKTRPNRDDADPKGCVICWHKYQGMMVYGVEYVRKSEMITHYVRYEGGPECMQPPDLNEPAAGRQYKCLRTMAIYPPQG